MWEHKAEKSGYFWALKDLCRFPDGRVPRKRKLKLDDITARISSAGNHQEALERLRESIAKEWSQPGRRLDRLFRETVLPQFVIWLNTHPAPAHSAASLSLSA
jgi:hypothetical protein